MMRALALAVAAFALVACSGAPKKTASAIAARVQSPTPAALGAPAARRSPYAPAQEDPRKRGDYTRGGLYAPHIADSAPDGLPDVDLIPEPEVRNEPRSRYGNRSPYVVLGQRYAVLPSAEGYDQTGIASFYGSKFHGRRTSSLEVYDMYAFSAAHKTLPLPSYARVTNLGNGKSVIVRINDRGPFHDGRLIDLSYAAAVKLGVDRTGTARVQVRGLSADDNAGHAAAAQAEAIPSPALPAGVHIATGKPAPGAVGGPPPSAIDRLLSTLPIAGVTAGERAPQAGVPARAASPSPVIAATPVDTDWRFDMRQDGRAMRADEFDAWMRSRRARVAAGKPGKPGTRAPPVVAMELATASAAIAPAAAAVPSIASGLAGDAPAEPAAAGGDSQVMFQVASFAARGNAEHALALLQGAGIDGARLQDAQANGRKVWRLRVGPVAAAAAPELLVRIQGLGFGRPQRVRE